MPDMHDEWVVRRKVLPVIYVIDTSDGMCGERIAKVNQAMPEMALALKDISDNDFYAEIKIAVLQFSSEAKWQTQGLVDMQSFRWDPMEAGGEANFSDMLDALHTKLSRSQYLNSDTGVFIPILFFVSVGNPADADGAWKKRLEWVNRNNKWFFHSTKIAMAVDEESDKRMLAELIGTPELVIGLDEFNILKNLLLLENTEKYVRKKEEKAKEFTLPSGDLTALWGDW